MNKALLNYDFSLRLVFFIHIMASFYSAKTTTAIINNSY